MELRPTEENANHGVELESYTTHSSSETGNLPSINDDFSLSTFLSFFFKNY